MGHKLGTCASCDHDRFFHVSNIETQREHIGDPIPCWHRDQHGSEAAVDCGCRALVKEREDAHR